MKIFQSFGLPSLKPKPTLPEQFDIKTEASYGVPSAMVSGYVKYINIKIVFSFFMTFLSFQLVRVTLNNLDKYKEHDQQMDKLIKLRFAKS